MTVIVMKPKNGKKGPLVGNTLNKSGITVVGINIAVTLPSFSIDPNPHQRSRGIHLGAGQWEAPAPPVPPGAPLSGRWAQGPGAREIGDKDNTQPGKGLTYPNSEPHKKSEVPD